MGRLRHANKTSSARPPDFAPGDGLSTDSNACADAMQRVSSPSGQPLERPVLPTVFFSYTGRLQESEVVAVAGSGHPTQTRIPLPGPSDTTDLEDFSGGRPPLTPRWTFKQAPLNRCRKH